MEEDQLLEKERGLGEGTRRDLRSGIQKGLREDVASRAFPKVTIRDVVPVLCCDLPTLPNTAASHGRMLWGSGENEGLRTASSMRQSSPRRQDLGLAQECSRKQEI